MSEQPLNYCRQMVSQYRVNASVPSNKGAQTLQHMIDLTAASQKFMLPDGGRIIDDLELKGLDPDVRLSLPFPFVALEWRSDGPVEPHAQACPKRVLLARADDDMIRCSPNVWVQAIGAWMPLPDFGIPVVGAVGLSKPGRRQINIRPTLGVDPEYINDCVDEASTLLAFLNALACSNVRIDVAPRRKAGKVKSAHQFDTYHVLTIEPSNGRGTGIAIHSRSPREHLRRGHIRRCASGLKTWVNATVVNAGIGGKVSKDYLL